jgi:hypothetical protein
MIVFPDPPSESENLSESERTTRALLDIFCMIGTLPARRVRCDLMNSFEVEGFLKLKQSDVDATVVSCDLKPHDIGLLSLEERADFIEGVVMLHRLLKPPAARLQGWPPAVQLPVVALASLLAKNHVSCPENYRLLQSAEWTSLKELNLFLLCPYEEWLKSLVKDAGGDVRHPRSELERQASQRLLKIVGYKTRA